MKKSAYENSKLKYQLINKKRNGVKELIWKLTPNQVEFVEEKFGFEVKPYLYEVKTRTFYNVRNLDNILKDIHYSCKRSKKVIVLKLNSKEKKVLKEFRIGYRPYKHKIKLC